MSSLTLRPNPIFLERSISKLKDYYALTKPEVNLLILMTTSAGFYLGSHAPLNIFRLLNTLVGTLLVASGTATLNQWMERVWDGRMRRTAMRPLPSGRLSPREALFFGIALVVGGTLYLAALVNWLSAFLAISTALSYLCIYTPLKRKTALCTLLGAVPGAMPTLIGWAGASGRIELRACVLFAVLFLWQFPHFIAIALMYREDYSRAGYCMIPGFDREFRFTRAELLGFTIVLITVTLLPFASSGGPVYLLAMASAGIFLLFHVLKLMGSVATVPASRVVHASVIYLPIVLGLMMAYRK